MTTSRVPYGFFDGRIPRVIGHRGSCGTHPENTIISFQAAVDAGADILEMDTHLTADNQVVVFHDFPLDRTTNGTGPIAAKTLAEIKQLDAGYNFTPDGGKTFPFRGKGITVPTLEEVLQSFPGVAMNIEIKLYNETLVKEFLKLVDKYNRFQDGTVMVFIVAEKPSLVKYIRQLEPRAVVGYTNQKLKQFWLLSLLRMPFLFKPDGPALQVPASYRGITIVTPNLVRCAHRMGMEIHVFTVNKEEDMKRLLAMGVDAIFTNYPARMRKLVDSGEWMHPSK